MGLVLVGLYIVTAHYVTFEMAGVCIIPQETTRGAEILLPAHRTETGEASPDPPSPQVNLGSDLTLIRLLGGRPPVKVCPRHTTRTFASDRQPFSSERLACRMDDDGRRRAACDRYAASSWWWRDAGSTGCAKAARRAVDRVRDRRTRRQLLRLVSGLGRHACRA